MPPAKMSNLQGQAAFVFSGVRPSSGAETLENDSACEISDSLERAEVAAAEDGRTPVIRYKAAARSVCTRCRAPLDTTTGASILRPSSVAVLLRRMDSRATAEDGPTSGPAPLPDRARDTPGRRPALRRRVPAVVVVVSRCAH